MPDTIYGDTYGMCHRSLWTDDVNPLFKDLFMELLHEKTDMIPDGFRVSQLALVALQDVCETLCKEAVDAADYEKQE
uniref:Uncharacterized protein n=1 Tax=viral metagenome TaxID=1070528 RepID=A0A6C0KGV3_9ZZZZ